MTISLYAWGYSGIVSLAKQWDRYVPLAIEAITNGENDEAPSGALESAEYVRRSQNIGALVKSITALLPNDISNVPA